MEKRSKQKSKASSIKPAMKIAENGTDKLIPPSAAEAEVKRKPIKNNLLPIIALFVALIGGIPGIINILTYLNRSQLQINFDEQNSVCAFIRSDNQLFNNKLAVLLYKISIAGKGSGPSFIKEFNLYLKCKGRWIKGNRYGMKGEEGKSYNFGRPSFRDVSIYIDKSPQENEHIILTNWDDFIPKNRGLIYGEPLEFSFASYFDLTKDDYDHCEELRIEVVDHLDSRYKKEIGADFFKKWYKKTFIDERT